MDEKKEQNDTISQSDIPSPPTPTIPRSQPLSDSIPLRLTHDQVLRLRRIHERFAIRFSEGLSLELRVRGKVEVASLEQVLFARYIQSLPNPTFLGLVNMEPLNGTCILEYGSSLSFPFLDRLSGGFGNLYRHNRELSEIERNVLGIIVDCQCKYLQEEWSVVHPLNFTLLKTHTNPQELENTCNPDECIMRITLYAAFNDIAGTITLAYPFSTLSQIGINLSYWNEEDLPQEAFGSASSRLKEITIPVHTDKDHLDIGVQYIQWRKHDQSVFCPYTSSNQPIFSIGAQNPINRDNEINLE